MKEIKTISNLEYHQSYDFLLYNNINFYMALAHLLYAIAIADRTISKDEKLKTISFVKKYWSKVLIKHQDTEQLIYSTLRELISKNLGAQPSFSVFSEFYYKNEKRFNKLLKEQIMSVCNDIAVKKGKRSKLELILLSKLHSLFYPPIDLI